MVRKFLFVVAALAVSSPALAKDHHEKSDADKKVCRYDNSTGSIMRKRICHTVVEWKQIDDANADAGRKSMDKFMTSRNMTGGSGVN